MYIPARLALDFTHTFMKLKKKFAVRKREKAVKKTLLAMKTACET